MQKHAGLVVLGGLLLAACASAPPPPGTGTSTKGARLDPRVAGFRAEVRDALDGLLAVRRSGAVAVFDWDNTMMRNDIGDATMAWLLAHDAILQPPQRDWAKTSADLTAAAQAALHAACDAAGEPEHPLATSRVVACADEIFAIYDHGKTHAGVAAWGHETTLTMKQPYAWEARLLAGHTPDEVRRFAREAYRTDSSAPIGATRVVGTHAGVSGWVRIYEPMRDLVRALRESGFEVWVVSASPQHVTEMVAAEVGIAADHVVGVRTAIVDGKLGFDLEGCGTAATNTVMTFDQGKRCWINKAIFHLPEAAQLARADAAHRPVFSAGDSDTDVAFVQDATELKLVIDRNKPALMCNALSNAGGRWLVQPSFLDPLPPRPEPYPCSSALDAAGAPLRDENGNAMRDQPTRR